MLYIKLTSSNPSKVDVPTTPLHENVYTVVRPFIISDDAFTLHQTPRMRKAIFARSQFRFGKLCKGTLCCFMMVNVIHEWQFLSDYAESRASSVIPCCFMVFLVLFMVVWGFVEVWCERGTRPSWATLLLGSAPTQVSLFSSSRQVLTPQLAGARTSEVDSICSRASSGHT